MDDKVTLIINFAGDALQKTEQLTGSLEKATEKADGLSGSFKKFGNQSIYINQLATSLSSAVGVLTDLADANRAQIEAQTQLEQVMRNTMGATREQVQRIYDLAAAQQQLGVIGDEVQLAGAQELGTYLRKTETLQQLLPVMNDMIAQQYGYNATQESAVNIATMMGKVMDGQTGALSRYGYSFTEAQEQILKFGTEEERAATLAEVITQSVGGMNQALAQTPTGHMQQLTNAIGDAKEKLGSYMTWAQPFASMLEPVKGLLGLLPVLKTLFSAVGSAGQKAFRMAGIAARWTRTQVVAVALSAQLSGGMFQLMAATAKASCKAIGLAIKSIPIVGWIAAGISLVVSLFALLWQKSEKFRIVVFTIWEAVKTVFHRVVNGMQMLWSRVYEGFLLPLWNGIRQAGAWISETFLRVVAAIRGAFQAAFEWVSGIVASVADRLATVCAPLVEAFRTAVGQITGFFDSAITWIRNKFDGVVGWIIDAYNKAAEVLGWEEIKSRGEAAGKASWAASQAEKADSGTTARLVDAVNAPLSTAQGFDAGDRQENSAREATQAVATGGTRNTEIHINIGDMIRQVVFNGTVQENRQDIERIFAESLSRVLGMAGA